MTAWGWLTMTTWEASTSVIVAPARSAIRRTTSLPAALSPVATTAQDGSVFQAGAPLGSTNPNAETGRWVAAMTAASSAGTSAAKASWNLTGSIANSTAVSDPVPVGYSSCSRALLSTLSLESASMSCRASPSSGAKAAT